MRKHIQQARKIKNRRAAIMENPRIRPMIELLNSHFYIPHFQGGYRWGKQQINELLDDILHYHNRQKHTHPFYCLQTIAMKKKKWTVYNTDQKLDGWEVIDGQQRLITILLILEYLASNHSESLREKLGENYTFYTIELETRVGSSEYFNNKSYKHKTDISNIDYYHISKAYQFIGQWFNEMMHNNITNAASSILHTLLDTQQNVSVVWYEYTALNTNKEEQDTNSSFNLAIRLNQEKIALSNAELIRALLLQADTYPASEKKFVNQKLLQIAEEWDEIEAKLRDDKMWYLINNHSYQPTSRIDILFKVMAEKWNNYDKQTLVQYDLHKSKPKHFDFMVFEKQLALVKKTFSNNLSDQSHVLDPTNELWGEIKSLFDTLEEWYTHHTLYHYIGLLFAINKHSKRKLLHELTALNMDKDEFLAFLKQKIADEINHNKNFDELQYGIDNGAIIKLLLLADIETKVAREDENIRFPFHLYKKDNVNYFTEPTNEASKDTHEAKAIAWLQQHKL